MEEGLMVGGLQELGLIKQKLIELDNYNAQKKTMDTEEDNLEKSISSKEKAIEIEIDKLIRARRAQIEATYDEQIAIVSASQKKVQTKKDKTKKVAVAERIETETAEFKNEGKALKLEGKSTFKQEKIPFLYNNRLFFALFFPKGFGDFCIILLTLALLLFIIPFGVYYLWFSGMSSLYLALFYIVVIVVFGGLYLVIGKMKCKHQEALDRVREMRRQIYDSKRQQRRIMRQIKRDKDESGYGLEEYSSEIESLQFEIGKFLEQKKAALGEFDSKTSSEIKEQITARNQTELDALKAEYKKIYELNRENQNRLNTLTIQIANEYEEHIAKELLTVEKIEQMEQIIQNGGASTIADAAAQVRQG